MIVFLQIGQPKISAKAQFRQKNFQRNKFQQKKNFGGKKFAEMFSLCINKSFYLIRLATVDEINEIITVQ